MTPSPDYVPFIDLTLHDKSPSDILAAGVATLRARRTDWVPEPTNVEYALMEAMAVEIAETLFTLNRLPRTMMMILLERFGVVRDAGATPTVDVKFTAVDDTGYVVPAGTEVSLPLGTNDYETNSDYMSFFTNLDLTIVGGTTTGTVSASAQRRTTVANGIATGARMDVIDALSGIEIAETASVVAGGLSPETDQALLERGTQRLQRLVDTLLIPANFTQAALEDPRVFRALTLDNFDPTAGSGAPGDHPGHSTIVVYGDDGPLSAGDKTALFDDLDQRTAANLILHIIDPTVTAVNVTVTVAAVPTYTPEAVQASVEAALHQYLSPTFWPWAGVVRRNEIIALADQVPGVDYVDTLTTPASDVTLTGNATLVTPGTITVNITGWSPA